MKKYPYISLVAAGIVAFAAPLITNAQTMIDTEAATGIGQSIDAGPNAGTMKLRDTLRQRIQQNYQTYEDRMRGNEDSRNAMLEKRSTSTPGMPGMPGRPLLHAEMELRHEGSTTRPIPPGMIRRIASSTEERRDNIRERMQTVRKAMFEDLRNRLVMELTRALDNLKQIRTRIAARISTETSNGKDMTSASSLLITADAKITLADQSIQALKAFTPAASTTVEANVSADASADIDLDKPRQIGADAIRAVNDARKALNDVVIAIARALGVELRAEIHATTTESTSASHQ